MSDEREIFELYLVYIGLNNPTTVVHKPQIGFDKVLTTQGLSIENLCKMWKWYFNIPLYCKVILKTNHNDFRAANQKTLTTSKSVKEIFKDNDVYMEEISDEEYLENVGEYRKAKDVRKETAEDILDMAHWVIRSDGTRVYVIHAEDIEEKYRVKAEVIE